MLNKNIVQTESVKTESFVAIHLAFDVSTTMELNLPDRTARGIENKEIAFFIERDSVGNQILRIAAGGCMRKRSGLATGPLRWLRTGRYHAYISAQSCSVAHWLYPKRLNTVVKGRLAGTASPTNFPDSPSAGHSVSRPEISVAIKCESVRPRHPRNKRHRRTVNARVGNCRTRGRVIGRATGGVWFDFPNEPRDAADHRCISNVQVADAVKSYSRRVTRARCRRGRLIWDKSDSDPFCEISPLRARRNSPNRALLCRVRLPSGGIKVTRGIHRKSFDGKWRKRGGAERHVFG